MPALYGTNGGKPGWVDRQQPGTFIFVIGKATKIVPDKSQQLGKLLASFTTTIVVVA